jgi:hypothetical protein
MESERNCASCYDDKPDNQFPVGRITQNCEHEITTICTICLQESIAAQSNGKTYDHINCPQEDCNMRLTYEDVQRWADPITFTRQAFHQYLAHDYKLTVTQRYSRLATREAIQSLPDFRWCAGEGCENGECYPNGERTPRISCSGCGGVNCYIHQRLWHEGQTCEEFDRVAGADPTQADAASAAMIHANTKRCPGRREGSTTTCNAPIMKNGGCSHMSCEDILQHFWCPWELILMQ